MLPRGGSHSPTYREARPESRMWPSTWSGWPDLNRRPLRPELAALLDVWPSYQLAVLAVVAAGGCVGRLLYFAAVLRLPHRLACRVRCSSADRPLSGELVAGAAAALDPAVG